MDPSVQVSEGQWIWPSKGGTALGKEIREGQNDRAVCTRSPLGPRGPHPSQAQEEALVCLQPHSAHTQPRPLLGGCENSSIYLAVQVTVIRCTPPQCSFSTVLQGQCVMVSPCFSGGRLSQRAWIGAGELSLAGRKSSRPMSWEPPTPRSDSSALDPGSIQPEGQSLSD